MRKEMPMRSLMYSVTTFALAGLAPLVASAQSSPKDLLNLRPTFPGIDCDTPTDAAAIDACKVENVVNAKGHNIGYALRDGQGKLLRKFVDTDGNNRLDQWSYYQQFSLAVAQRVTDVVSFGVHDV